MPPENTKNKATLSYAERDALDVAKDPILKQMLDEERVESSEIDTSLLLRLLRYLRPHLPLAFGAVLLATFEAILMTLPAFAIGLAIDRVSSTEARAGGFLESLFIGLQQGIASLSQSIQVDDPSHVIVVFGILLAVIWTLRWCTGVITTYTVQKLGQQVVHDVRMDVFRHLIGMDIGYFHKNPRRPSGKPHCIRYESTLGAFLGHLCSGHARYHIPCDPYCRDAYTRCSAGVDFIRGFSATYSGGAWV